MPTEENISIAVPISTMGGFVVFKRAAEI